MFDVTDFDDSIEEDVDVVDGRVLLVEIPVDGVPEGIVLASEVDSNDVLGKIREDVLVRDVILEETKLGIEVSSVLGETELDTVLDAGVRLEKMELAAAVVEEDVFVF